MAIRYAKIGKLNFTFVFRHRFEKPNKDSLLEDFTLWREWELGFWFRRMKIVGKKNFHNPKEWGNNLVHSYMLGINLLLCKAWLTLDKGGMSIKLKDKSDED
jgi:hypothetical protein